MTSLFLTSNKYSDFSHVLSINFKQGLPLGFENTAEQQKKKLLQEQKNTFLKKL